MVYKIAVSLFVIGLVLSRWRNTDIDEPKQKLTQCEMLFTERMIGGPYAIH